MRNTIYVLLIRSVFLLVDAKQNFTFEINALVALANADSKI